EDVDVELLRGSLVAHAQDDVIEAERGEGWCRHGVIVRRAQSARPANGLHQREPALLAVPYERLALLTEGATHRICVQPVARNDGEGCWRSLGERRSVQIPPAEHKSGATRRTTNDRYVIPGAAPGPVVRVDNEQANP